MLIHWAYLATIKGRNNLYYLGQIGLTMVSPLLLDVLLQTSGENFIIFHLRLNLLIEL